MTKVESIKFGDFMSGDWKEKKDYKTAKLLSATIPALVLIVPKMAFAAAVDGTFGNVHKAVMNMFDAGVVLIIIFAGVAWSFGHRSKAIEILIGVSCGYILARHATDIRDFLRGI